MADNEHIHLIRLGVERWNEWRKANPGVVPDFRNADFTGVNLRGGDFRGADFTRAVVRDVDLSWSNFVEAKMGWVEFGGARLFGADFRKTFLGGADFRNADLSWADFREADFSWAYLGEAILWRTFLRGAKHLTPQQLMRVKTLHGAQVDAAVLKSIRKKCPHLLEKSEDWKNFLPEGKGER